MNTVNNILGVFLSLTSQGHDEIQWNMSLADYKLCNWTGYLILWEPQIHYLLVMPVSREQFEDLNVSHRVPDPFLMVVVIIIITFLVVFAVNNMGSELV